VLRAGERGNLSTRWSEGNIFVKLLKKKKRGEEKCGFAVCPYAGGTECRNRCGKGGVSVFFEEMRKTSLAGSSRKRGGGKG